MSTFRGSTSTEKKKPDFHCFFFDPSSINLINHLLIEVYEDQHFKSTTRRARSTLSMQDALERRIFDAYRSLNQSNLTVTYIGMHQVKEFMFQVPILYPKI